MKTIRISELPLVGSLKGLFSIGVDKDSRSVKFSLQTVEEAIAAKQDKGDYALKSELPDISNLAKKSEIPDISGLATKSEVSRVEGQAATNAANILKKVDKVDGKGLSTNDYTDSDKDKVGKALTEHQSLGNYYTKEEVDSKVAQGGTFDPTSYYNKRDIDDLMEGKADADTAVLSYDASWVLGLVKTGGIVSEEQFAAISAAVEAGSLVTLADSGVAYQAAASLEVNASASLGAVINLLCPVYNTSLALYRIAKDRTIAVIKFALVIDTELNATSRNAVINSAVTAALADKQDKGNYVKATELSAVAKTGSYNDLSNRPSIPSEVTEQTVSGWGFTKNTGTYSKPAGGIPKSDLASAVQTSLGKAETALQSVPSTYRTAEAQDAIDSGKVDKVTGKGLSTNDYTDEDKQKVGLAITSHQSLEGYAKLADVKEMITDAVIMTINTAV